MGSVKAESETPAEPKRRRKSRANAETTGSTETPEAEADDVPDWVPRSKSWEKEVDRVDTIIRDSKTNSLIAFLKWTNGKSAKVSIETCYEKCPRKAGSA
jgi:chromobox protein 1